jgi:hypothetical protein
MTGQQPDLESRVEQPDAEYRRLVTDIALFAGPVLAGATGAATAWALNEYGPSSDPPRRLKRTGRSR